MLTAPRFQGIEGESAGPLDGTGVRVATPADVVFVDRILKEHLFERAVLLAKIQAATFMMPMKPKSRKVKLPMSHGLAKDGLAAFLKRERKQFKASDPIPVMFGIVCSETEKRMTFQPPYGACQPDATMDKSRAEAAPTALVKGQ